MKTVVLLGDSIRMDYQEGVRRLLSGLAEVWFPEVNCSHSECILEHMEEWIFSRRPSIVHLNCGLHDLVRRIFDDKGIVAFDKEHYRLNVEKIIALIQKETDARVLWASTTPIVDERHNSQYPFWRFEEDVRAYNEIAAAVMAEMEVPIDDLHSFVVRSGTEMLQLPDGCHYSRHGAEQLAKEVATFIRRYL